MNIKNAEGAIEALIFASGEPIALQRIETILELKKDDVEKIVTLLMEKYNTEFSGINLIKLDDCVQFCTNKKYAPQVRELLDIKRNAPLSPASLEVLAVIAYNQPVTKAFVEQIRGVDCSGIIGSLQTKGLIEEKGRLELPGRPIIYGTTQNFMRSMGITSLSELIPVKLEENEENESKDEDNA